MRLDCAPSDPAIAATAGAVLFNEGLEPGLRVTLDDRADLTATVCSVEAQAPFAFVLLDGSGQHVRLESWRLGLLG